MQKTKGSSATKPQPFLQPENSTPQPQAPTGSLSAVNTPIVTSTMLSAPAITNSLSVSSYAPTLVPGGPYTFRVRRQLPYMTRATTVTATNYKELLQKIRAVFGFPEDSELRIVDLRGYAELKGSQNQQNQHQHIATSPQQQQAQASQSPPTASVPSQANSQNSQSTNTSPAPSTPSSPTTPVAASPSLPPQQPTAPIQQSTPPQNDAVAQVPASQTQELSQEAQLSKDKRHFSTCVNCGGCVTPQAWQKCV